MQHHPYPDHDNIRLTNLSIFNENSNLHALWIPAPVFCWIMHVTTYLNGLFILLRLLIHASIIELQYAWTFSGEYFRLVSGLSYRPKHVLIA